MSNGLFFGSWFLLKAEVKLAQRCGHKWVYTNSKFSCLTKYSIHIGLLTKQWWLLVKLRLKIWSLLGWLLYRLLSRQIKCTKVSIFLYLLGIHLRLRLHWRRSTKNIKQVLLNYKLWLDLSFKFLTWFWR